MWRYVQNNVYSYRCATLHVPILNFLNHRNKWKQTLNVCHYTNTHTDTQRCDSQIQGKYMTFSNQSLIISWRSNLKKL